MKDSLDGGNGAVSPWFRWGGLMSLALGVLGAAAIGQAMSSPAGLVDVWHRFSCAPAGTKPDVALRLYAAQANWMAVIVLEGVVAAVAVVVSVAALVGTGNRRDFWRRPESWTLVVAGVAAVGYDAHQVNLVRTSTDVHAFLTALLASLPPECASVRSTVFWARLVGEPPGIVLGVAMAGAGAFVRAPTPAELATRLERLKRLLYVASLLFVAGIMMSRANFTLVLAHWDVDDDKVFKGLGEVIKAGVVQSGVGYSGLLATFFLPVRALLAHHVDASIPAAVHDSEKEKKKWLREHGLSGSWQEDARQLLALLAPVLSAPVFDAIAKS